MNVLVHRLLAALLLAGALAGCSAAPSDLAWTIDFANPTLRARAAVVRASITREDCAGEEVYVVLLRPGENMGPLPPALARGAWGFHAVATDASCVRFAETCDVVSLPTSAEVRSLLAASATEITECAPAACDEGSCPQPDAGLHDAGTDAGIDAGSLVDAGDAAIAADVGIDGAAPDAATDDSGSDAASSDSGTDAGPVDGGRDTGVTDPCASALGMAASRAGCNGGFESGTPARDEPAGECDNRAGGRSTCRLEGICSRGFSSSEHCYPYCTPSSPTAVSTGDCMTGYRCFQSLTSPSDHVCVRDCDGTHPCPGDLECGSAGGCY